MTARRLADLALVAAAVALVMVVTLRPARGETVDGRSIRVIDGDTVELPPSQARRRERLRLVRIDAPEISHPRCAAEVEPARQASRRLADLLAAGPVEIRRTGRIDRYGRSLGRLVAPAGDVETILLAERLAVEWRPGRAAWDARKRHWCGRLD